MLKQDDAPIEESEWLLRRVHRSHFGTDDAGHRFVMAIAFRPRGANSRDPDSTGISLFREACLERPDAILANVAREKLGDQGIASIRVSRVRELGLSVQSEPHAPTAGETFVPGHVVIPELNARSTDEHEDTAWVREELASAATMRMVRLPNSSL